MTNFGIYYEHTESRSFYLKNWRLIGRLFYFIN